MKIPIFTGKYYQNGGYSMAMLVTVGYKANLGVGLKSQDLFKEGRDPSRCN